MNKLEILELLASDSLDSSDFLLLSLELVDGYLTPEQVASLKKHYLNNDYVKCMTQLRLFCSHNMTVCQTELEARVYRVIILNIQNIRFRQNDNAYGNLSRRYFETILVDFIQRSHDMDLDSKAPFFVDYHNYVINCLTENLLKKTNEVDELEKKLQDTPDEPSLKRDYQEVSLDLEILSKSLEKCQYYTIGSVEHIKAIFAAYRELWFIDNDIANGIANLSDFPDATLKLKDRGNKRILPLYSSTKGIITASSAVPLTAHEDRLVREGGLVYRKSSEKIVDQFDIDPLLNPGFSKAHPEIPFINSISGSTYCFLNSLKDFMVHQWPHNAPLEHASIITQEICKAYLAYLVINGYHCLRESLEVLNDKYIAEVFSSLGITLKVDDYLFNTSQGELNLALRRSAEFVVQSLRKEKLHAELLGVADPSSSYQKTFKCKK